MDTLVVGLSHKTAPIEIREKLHIPEEKIGQSIAELCSYPHIQEAAIISTCNRLEIYIMAADIEQATREISRFLLEYSDISDFHYLFEHLFFIKQQDVVKHLMEVASGLDSLVIGEGQIMAQVKRAYKLGQEYGGVKRVLNQLFKQSIITAKRVRTEIAIGKGAVSISSAAVELAKTKLENLSDCRTTIVGAGKMARLLVKHLLSKGVTEITIVNPSFKRVELLIEEFETAQIRYCPFTGLMDAVAESDVVFTSTASQKTLIDKEKLETVLKPQQSLMLFDISVPRNIDVDVERLEGVQSFNVDHLNTVVLKNQEKRLKMAIEAQVFIGVGVQEFDLWWRSIEVTPTICCLREKMEKIREQELQKALSRFGAEFPKKHQKMVESLTRGIINKVLHEPMIQLKAQKDLNTQRLVVSALKVLFQLDDSDNSQEQQLISNIEVFCRLNNDDRSNQNLNLNLEPSHSEL